MNSVVLLLFALVPTLTTMLWVLLGLCGTSVPCSPLLVVGSLVLSCPVLLVNLGLLFVTLCVVLRLLCMVAHDRHVDITVLSLVR